MIGPDPKCNKVYKDDNAVCKYIKFFLEVPIDTLYRKCSYSQKAINILKSHPNKSALKVHQWNQEFP